MKIKKTYIKNQPTKTQYTMESWMISNAKAGTIFYSTKADRHLTAIAARQARKILTERVAVVSMKNHDLPIASPLTKVTLL